MSIKRHGKAKRVRTQEWDYVLGMLQVEFLQQGIEEYDSTMEYVKEKYKRVFLEEPFHRVMDLLQMIMRHLEKARDLAARDSMSFFGFMDNLVRPRPRGSFTNLIDNIFKECGLAYYVDTTGSPTILPAVSDMERKEIQRALILLPERGYASAEEHLRKSLGDFRDQDWSSSVHESIMAVEAVGRTIHPDASTLGKAANKLKQDGRMHTALCEAVIKLWGYANAIPGIRHAGKEIQEAVGEQQERVAMKEAALMLAVCAAFSNYIAVTYGPQTK